jgi:hypothetical protein
VLEKGREYQLDDSARNEAVLRRDKESNILHAIKRRNCNWTG